MLKAHFSFQRFIFSQLAILLLLCVASQTVASRDFSNGKEGILLVAFGTSLAEARSVYKKIDASYKSAFPGYPIEWAYTSGKIRAKLHKDGVEIKSVSQALESLAGQGVSIVRAQSLHLLNGAEYLKFIQELARWEAENPHKLDALLIGSPLLDSRTDGQKVADALMTSLPREESEALVLMAHGNSKGRAGLALEGLRTVLREKDPLVFLASVEGEQSYDELLAELRKACVRKLLLAPLLLVAGDHAQNDMAGDAPDSWASLLKSAGYEVKSHVAGLGELPDIQEIFIDHARQPTIDELIKKP